MKQSKRILDDDEEEEEEEEEEVTMVEGETAPLDGAFYVDKFSNYIRHLVHCSLRIIFQIHISLLDKEEDSGTKPSSVSI